MFRKLLVLSSLVLSAFTANAAVTFSVTPTTISRGIGYGVDAAELVGTLLDVSFSATNSANNFVLINPGDAQTFKVGDISLSEVNINNQETDDLDVSVTFVFSSPFSGSQIVTTTGVATSGLVAGPGIDFTIDWAPVVINFGNGGSFLLNLDTLNFRNQGSLVQEATIRLRAAEAPEPASLALVGLALVGLGAARRRRT